MTETVLETSNEQPSFVDRTAQRVEELIDQLETQEKPWFLKTNEIYKVSRDAALAIPHGVEYFDKSLEAVSKVTNYITERTKIGVAFDVEKSHELIAQLDGLLGQQLVRVDDGFDHLRSRLAVSLRNLMGAIVLHKNMVADYAQDQSKKTQTILRTRFEQAMEVLDNLLIVAKEKYQEASQKVSNLLHDAEAMSKDVLAKGTEMANTAMEDTKTRLLQLNESTGLHALTLWALQHAQPYVQLTVARGQPYVFKAIEMSKPYVEPYVEPLMQKAKEVQGKVMEHKVIGPYASKAYDTAQLLLEETKVYCIPQEATAAH